MHHIYKYIYIYGTTPPKSPPFLGGFFCFGMYTYMSYMTYIYTYMYMYTLYTRYFVLGCITFQASCQANTSCPGHVRRVELLPQEDSPWFTGRRKCCLHKSQHSQIHTCFWPEEVSNFKYCNFSISVFNKFKPEFFSLEP